MSHVKQQTLKKLLGEAGAGMSSEMGGSVPSAYDLMKAVVEGARNKLVEGLKASAPTTPSAQVTGNGNTSWRVNMAVGRVVVDGTPAEIAAAADTVIHSGSELLDSGQSVVAAVVAKKVSGTVSVVSVKGTPATTGSQLAPSKTEIQNALGAGVPWVKLAECTLNRTADTTVTQSEDNTKADFGHDTVAIEK